MRPPGSKRGSKRFSGAGSARSVWSALAFWRSGGQRGRQVYAAAQAGGFFGLAVLLRQALLHAQPGEQGAPPALGRGCFDSQCGDGGAGVLASHEHASGNQVGGGVFNGFERGGGIGGDKRGGICGGDGPVDGGQQSGLRGAGLARKPVGIGGFGKFLMITLMDKRF